MEETPSQKTGILYCRVSSKEQVENTSLESQERYCREYATRNDIAISDVYVDKGESAKTADRPEFMKAISFCINKNNRVDYFIVYKLDRFARNQDDHVMVRAKLRQGGTELRSVTEPINETPVGRAMEGMISVFAEFDNNVRTERTKGGMLERIKQGVWVWQAPLGYYRVAKGANITPDPNSAPLIRLGFEEWTKGTHSYHSLAQFLARKGLKTRHGRKPFAQLVEAMLRNSIYCGVINVWGGQYEGSFAPIVSKELFNRCQKGYNRRKARFAHRSKSNPTFPLRRMTICGFCNASLTGSVSTGSKGMKYAYYHHQKQECSQAQFIPKDTFEQNFVEYLESITPDAQYEKLFKAIVLDIWKNNYKNLDATNERIRRNIKQLEEERQRVFDLHRSGTYSDEDFTEQKRLVNQKIIDQRCMIQDTQVEEFNMEEALDYCFRFVRSTAATWLRLKAKYDIRLRFQKMIFEKNIRFDGKKFGTATLTPVYKLNQEYHDKKSDLVPLIGKYWNEITADLKEWFLFGKDMQKEDDPPKEELIYKPVKPDDLRDESYGYSVAA